MKSVLICLIVSCLLVFQTTAGHAQIFCDQPTGGPGFPGFPECENAVCAQDQFCCDNTWDSVCASLAGSLGECIPCLSQGNPAISISGNVIIDYNCDGALNGDDFTSGGHEILDDGFNVLATSDQNGAFDFNLLASNNYSLGVEDIDGFTNPSFDFTTPDTSTSYNVTLSLCPIPDYYNLAVSVLLNPPTIFDPSAGSDSWNINDSDPLAIQICATNLSGFTSSGTVQLIFNEDHAVITDDGGGALGNGLITWDTGALDPFENVCYTVLAIPVEGVIPGTLVQFEADVDLGNGFPEDQNPDDDSEIEELFFSDNGITPFCDQPQVGAGFPTDLGCQAAICSADPFCCNQSWDVVCAGEALNAPECSNCLTTAGYSTIGGQVFLDYNCDATMNGNDFPVDGFSVVSDVDGVITSSGDNGEYLGIISPETAHQISVQTSGTFTVGTPIILSTPDTANNYVNMNIGICPVTDYNDVNVQIVGGEFGTNEVGVQVADELEFDVCIQNETAFPVDADIHLTYNNEPIILVNSDGGSNGPGTIDWNATNIPPLGTVCYTVQAAIALDAIPESSSNIVVTATMGSGFSSDQDLTDNEDQINVNIEEIDLSPEGEFCDVSQPFPGFPAAPACEQAICSNDPFCCNNQWDNVCASAAAFEPACESCLYIASAAVVNGMAFVDYNCDGLYNGTDVPADGITVVKEGVILGMTNVAGQYTGYITAGQSMSVYATPLSGFTVNSHELFLDTTGTISDVNFAYCPQGAIVNLGVSLSPVGLPPRPGFPVEYQVCVNNFSTSEVEAQVTFDFSNMPNATVIDADGGEVVGSEIIWDVDPMGVFGETCFDVVMQVVQGTPPGTIMNPVASVEPVPSGLMDIEHENDEHSFSHEVVAAYDPNDKTVDYPVVNFTEIEEGEGVQLEYLIRFQNTGNFFATNVRVEDQLPELLNINSIEMIHASHDYEIVIHPNNTIEWVFENIMLPDSTTNEPESHGQIHFRINTVSDVSLEDVIENQASIFFDFKEPVVTEPAVTTFMDCSEGSLDVLGLEAVCEGEVLTLNANRPDFENYTWIIDGQILEGSEIEVTAPASSVNVMLTATHQVCELSTTVTLDVIEVPEVEITIEDDLLVTDPNGESYAWYLDGELLEWATESWIVPAENGNYQVIVTYAEGCTGSDDLLYQSVGIDSADEQNVLLIPNPARGTTQLTLPKGAWQVSLMSVSGKTISTFENITTSNLTLDLQNLASGLYFVNVQSKEFRKVEKLVVE